MHSFRRRRGQLTCTFEAAELSVMTSLVDQFMELLTGDDMPPRTTNGLGEQDLFAELERELNDPPTDDFRRNPDVDPALRRLFPDAYQNDPQASSEFRRFSLAEQRDAKLDAAVAMLSDLNQVGGDMRCAVPDEHIDAWLKTLTAVRLALSVRLGILTADDADRLAELPEDDPMAAVFSVYEWLGWVQESSSTASTDPPPGRGPGPCHGPSAAGTRLPGRSGTGPPPWPTMRARRYGTRIRGAMRAARRRRPGARTGSAARGGRGGD